MKTKRPPAFAGGLLLQARGCRAFGRGGLVAYGDVGNAVGVTTAALAVNAQVVYAGHVDGNRRIASVS